MTDVDEQRDNVRLAYLALCLSGGRVTPKALVNETLRIADATKDGSLAVLVQKSVRIRSKVVYVAFEESSRRYLISYVASNSPTGEIEKIRSERVDGIHGALVSEIWKEVTPGDEVVIFKHNEEASDERMSHGYRVAPWVTVIRKGE